MAEVAVRIFQARARTFLRDSCVLPTEPRTLRFDSDSTQVGSSMLKICLIKFVWMLWGKRKLNPTSIAYIGFLHTARERAVLRVALVMDGTTAPLVRSTASSVASIFRYYYGWAPCMSFVQHVGSAEAMFWTTDPFFGDLIVTWCTPNLVISTPSFERTSLPTQAGR